MRTSLRRSCHACAKAKLRCDLQTPRCTRCARRKASCVYANQPLTSSSGPSVSPKRIEDDDFRTPKARSASGETSPTMAGNSISLVNPATSSFDPFDSYPPTRLSRTHVQRLIHHFLSSIAFQYYPLDMSMQSNPFVLSWWPLALEDPALFHVSLQTASLDEELRAQKGFHTSEILMADSVSEVRRKIQDSSSAFRDETINAVVTLAAIEHGKGNVESSRMHIDGVKRMIAVRGGIDQVKRANPLTARMVSWVSLLVTGVPQFDTQDDDGRGDGISPISRWELASGKGSVTDETLQVFNIDPILQNILGRLRCILQDKALTSMELHDLTCFVVHRLLLLPPLSPFDPIRSAISESLRCGLALYMLVIHGTTYYSHVELAHRLISRLKHHLGDLSGGQHMHDSLLIWIISVGMVTAVTPMDQLWFINKARAVSTSLGITTWDAVADHLHRIIWLQSYQDDAFRSTWHSAFDTVPLQSR